MMKYTRYQQGATLIEVAITVLILATSLLAMSTLQTRSLQFNQSAFMRSQANIHVYDIMDRMRINRGVDGDSRLTAYNVDYGSSPRGTNPVATSDVTAWLAQLQKSLPDGKGKIVCVQTTRICTISVKWEEKMLFSEDGDTEATTELKFTSVI